MTICLTMREKQILKMLTDDSEMSVSVLSEQLEVSEVTIRNDLNALANKGFIIRTQGGAFPAFHQSILDRQRVLIDEKQQIAKAAAEMVEDGMRIMISAGTTSSLIPKYLLGKRDVHIVTNSTLLLPYIRVNPSLEVTFVGGDFSASGEAMVGSIAIAELKNLHVKYAFVGTDGFSLEGGAASHSVKLAEVVSTMSEQADETILLSDSTKYGKKGFAHMLSIEQISMLITDNKLKEGDKTKLEKKGVKVQIA